MRNIFCSTFEKTPAWPTVTITIAGVYNWDYDTQNESSDSFWVVSPMSIQIPEWSTLTPWCEEYQTSFDYSVWATNSMAITFEKDWNVVATINANALPNTQQYCYFYDICANVDETSQRQPWDPIMSNMSFNIVFGRSTRCTITINTDNINYWDVMFVDPDQWTPTTQARSAVIPYHDVIMEQWTPEQLSIWSYTILATPESWYDFDCWVDGNNNDLTSDLTQWIDVTWDMTLVAKFKVAAN
jgi:hypothetical protein